MHALTKDELYRVLRVARARRARNWLMYLLTYNHALRASETLALTPDNFHGNKFHSRRLKGSRPAEHALVTDPDPLLSEVPAVFEYIRFLHPNQRLFPISRVSFWRNFHRDAVTAGVDEFRAHPHVLKHTILTEVKDSVDIKTLQVFAGHVNGACTLIYQDVTPEEAADAVNAARKRPRKL